MTTPEEIRGAWDKIAPGYDEIATPVIMPMAENALDRVGLRPGIRLLDVAAGTGALSLPAARRDAQVVATDISPAMIERLKARAREEALSNIEALVMDGYDLELEDDTFHVSASQNGVSLFPDLKRGLSELVRVTKPGGRQRAEVKRALAKAFSERSDRNGRAVLKADINVGIGTKGGNR